MRIGSGNHAGQPSMPARKGAAISGVSIHTIIGGKLREKNKRNERGLKVPSQFGSTGFNSGGFWGATCRVYVSFIFLETLKIVLIT